MQSTALTSMKRIDELVATIFRSFIAQRLQFSQHGAFIKTSGVHGTSRLKYIQLD